VIYRIVKRVFDVVCSLVGIIVTSPLWLVILIGIKASSKGPFFYTTERIGKKGKPFTLYKFRSMHEYKPDGTGKKREGSYIANDDRIFPLGKILRKSKLDELPQVINILAGQMSVVGPRPLPPVSAGNNYSGKYACALDMRPGLTCLDSLYDYAHGELFVKDNATYKQTVVPMKNELAKMYVERADARLDLHCITRTAGLMWRIAVKKQKTFPLTKYETEAEEQLRQQRGGTPGTVPSVSQE
jgi:lipopolysaccharide/colanic/teichoic acid biosynthesis glycosyltransferase